MHCQSSLNDFSGNNSNMNLFVLSAKTPDLLFHVLLLLATVKSLHANEATTAMGPTDTAPTVGNNSITIRQTIATTQSLSANATTLNGTETDIQNRTEYAGNVSVSDPRNITSDVITSPSPTITTVAPASTNDTATTVKTDESGGESEGGSEGAVIVVLLLLAIICLGVLLYYMRKKSRSYSFDLFTPDYEQASDNAPLKPMEMETFQPKDTETLANVPTVVIESAEIQPESPDSPKANGSVEEGPGDPVITLDNESIKSAPSECGSQTEFLPKDSTDADVEQQPGNENNNNFTASTKATAGLKSGETNFTEISLN